MRLRLSHIIAGLVGMAMLASLQWLWLSKRPRAIESRPTPKAAMRQPPWGELEITPLVLDRPEELFLTNAWDGVIRWSFPKQSAEQIRDLITECDLTLEQRTALLATNRWQATANGWRILPPLDVVAEMRPKARERIYSVLAETPENTNQHWAFFFRADGLDEWLSHSDLPSDALDLARRLCYTKNQRVYFADSQIFELLRSPDEVRRLVQTLARVPTLLMKVRVTPESDIKALIDYWGRFRKDDEVDDLLRSMARVPGGASINVAYFMPPVSRTRLYTYPEPETAERHDCFWTSFNFFHDQPRHQFTNAADYNGLLRKSYDPVTGPKLFGDLLLLLESREIAAHMCVYIADDVVFTKNGTDFKQPWVLMRMKDMMTLYASEKPQQWRVFRKKDT